MEFTLENATCVGLHTAKDIFPVFTNVELRTEWDTLLKTCVVKEEIDELNDVVHATFGDVEGDGRNDLCLLRSWRTPEFGSTSNHYLLSSRSIIHPLVPEVDGVKRGFISPSGFIVSDLPDQRIQVTYVMQITGSTLQFTLDHIPVVTLQRFKNLQKWYSNLGP